MFESWPRWSRWNYPSRRARKIFSAPIVSTPLVIQDAIHGHSAESLLLTQHNVLAIQDALHGHTAENLDLTQHNILVIQDALHGHAAENVVLTQHNVLAIQDALHGHTLDNLTLTVHDAVLLVIQDALHSHAAESLTLIQHYFLVIADALHKHRTDQWSALVPIGDGDETVVYNADGTITLYDGGDGDFWSTADNGAMITHDIPTPGMVEVTVTLGTPEGNARFVGLRSSDAAGAAMFVLLTDADNSHFSTVWRDTVNGVAGYQGENNGPARFDPVRARVVYDGAVAYAYVSSDGGASWSLINSRAIGVTLSKAFLGRGGGAGTHTASTYTNEMQLQQHNILAIQDALHGHVADNVTLSIPGGAVGEQPEPSMRRRRGLSGRRH